MSTKLTVLEWLAQVADQVIVGGGIANAFIAAAGHSVGASLLEPELVSAAAELATKVSIPVPQDVVVAKGFAADAPHRVCAVDQVGDDEMILDIGPATAAAYGQLIAQAGTVLWNGPVGVLNFPPSAPERKPQPGRLPPAPPSPSLEAVTPSRRSISTPSRTSLAISPPVAGLSWSSWKANPACGCRP